MMRNVMMIRVVPLVPNPGVVSTGCFAVDSIPAAFNAAREGRLRDAKDLIDQVDLDGSGFSKTDFSSFWVRGTREGPVLSSNHRSAAFISL